MSKDYYWTLFFLNLIFGFVGRYVSIQKNRSKTEGFLFGFFFSIFGLLIISLLPIKQSYVSSNTIKETIPFNSTDVEKKSVDFNRILLILLLVVILILFLYTGFLRGDFKL